MNKKLDIVQKIPFLEHQHDGVERSFRSSVRPKRNDEVIQSVAGVVSGNDNGPVGPVVVLRSLELTVLTRLNRVQPESRPWRITVDVFDAL